MTSEPEYKNVILEDASLWSILEAIEEVLESVHDFPPFTVHALDGRDVDSNKDRRSERAAMARDLLRAAEAANLLAAELHVRYQQMKGNRDPREERA